MILLKLLVLVLVSSLCDSDIQPKRNYLIYATENDGILKFIQNDLDFGSPKTLLEINTNGKIFDKMQLGPSEDGELLYWSYKNSIVLGRFDVTSGVKEEKDLNQKFDRFLGTGNNDTIYFYYKDNKTFAVYDYKNNVEKWQIVISEEADLHCAAVDPSDRWVVFFTECIENGINTAKFIIADEMKVLQNYSEDLQYCFDICGITPDAKKTYAVKSKQIFVSPEVGENFETFTSLLVNIQELAVGNNELFYTTEESGGTAIYKRTEVDGNVVPFNISGTVKALAIHQE